MLEVIGAGFGRTGTHSLGLALEKLELSPCYNLLEVTKNAEHVDIWVQAMDGKPVNWSRIFEGYRSTVEWPGATFFDELAQQPIPMEPFPCLNERNEFMVSEPEWAKKVKDEKRQKGG